MVWIYGGYVVFMTAVLCRCAWNILSDREKEKKLEYEWAKRDRELGINRN